MGKGRKRRGPCQVCDRSGTIHRNLCSICGARWTPGLHDKLKQIRASLWDLARFYDEGHIPIETYSLLSKLIGEKAFRVINLLSSRRRRLANLPVIPAGEDDEARDAPEKAKKEAATVKPPAEVPAEPEAEVSAEAPEESAPEPAAVTAPEPAEKAAPEAAEAAGEPDESKWTEVVSKTLLFLGVAFAIGAAIYTLIEYGDSYHPIRFLWFPGATLGIFGAALAAKWWFEYPWTSLTFSVLAALLAPLNFHAAYTFRLIDVERFMFGWGWVGLGCAVLYVLGAKVARERTLLFLGAMAAPTGGALLVAHSGIRDGAHAVVMSGFALGYLVYAALHREDRFRGPVFRLAGYVTIGAVPVLMLVLLALGSADLFDLSMTCWSLSAVCLVWGLRWRVFQIQYATASLLSLGGLLWLEHMSEGTHNASPFVMLVGAVVFSFDIVLRRLGKESDSRPFAHLALALGGLAILFNLSETPPMELVEGHEPWTVYVGALLIGAYFSWKVVDTRRGEFLIPVFLAAYSIGACAVRTFEWSHDNLWLVGLGVGLLADGFGRLRPQSPAAPVSARLSWIVVPAVAAISGLANFIADRPEAYLYPLIALPVAGVHALICGLPGRRTQQVGTAAVLLAAVPLFVMLQFDRPWFESAGYLVAGAIVITLAGTALSRRWGELATIPLDVCSAGLTLLGIGLGAAALLDWTLGAGAGFAPGWLAVAGAGACGLHLLWADRYRQGWHWAAANAGLLILLFVVVEILRLPEHLYALLPVALGAVNGRLSNTTGEHRFEPSLRLCAMTLVGLTLSIYVPLVYLLESPPGALFPVVTALVAAMTFAVLAQDSRAPGHPRIAVALVFLAILFIVTLQYAAGWEWLFVGFALLACGAGVVGWRSEESRWGLAAGEVATVVAAVMALVVTWKVGVGDISLGIGAGAYLLCAMTLGVSGVAAEAMGIRRSLAPVVVLTGALSLLGFALCWLEHLNVPTAMQGQLLVFLVLGYVLGGIACERRGLGKLNMVLYSVVAGVIVISVVFIQGTVTEALGTFFSWAAIFGIAAYLVRREFFFYASAFSFSLGFLFLMRWLGASALTVAMWEAVLAVTYVFTGRLFFPGRSWIRNPLAISSLLITFGVVIAFMGLGRQAIDMEQDLMSAIKTSMIFAFMFSVMARATRNRGFYALAILMVFSAYYLAVQHIDPGPVEWYTLPPALLAGVLGVHDLRRKTVWVSDLIPPRGLIVAGLAIFYAPALVRSVDPDLVYEGLLIFLTGGALVYLAATQLHIKVLFWGSVAVSLVNLIIWTFLQIPWSRVPQEIWWLAGAAFCIGLGFMLEKKFKARIRARLLEMRGGVEKFFTDWV